MDARPPPLHESVRTHQVRVSRAKTVDAHRRPPIAPTDPPTLTAMRRLACCRRPLTISATSSGRAPGGRSVEYIVSDDCRPSGAVGAGPVREEQRVPSRW